MRLKVDGKEAVICSYCVEPRPERQTLFKRRAYWLKDSPKFILVHYLEEDPACK